MKMHNLLNKGKVAFIIFAFFATAACGRGTSVVGQPAPEFTLDLFDGGQIGISDLRGKPVILYFFASW